MRAAPTVSLAAFSQPIISQAVRIDRLTAWLRALRSAREKMAAASPC
jgi:hypothetical protein